VAHAIDWDIYDMLKFSDYPVHYSPTAKCGCTSVKNLIYYYNTGKFLEEKDSVHKIFVDNKWNSINSAPKEKDIVFAIVRNPVGRFFSFYMDKIANDGPYSFKWVKSLLVNHYGVVLENSSDNNLNYSNCMKTLDFIEDNLVGRSPMRRVDSHWQMQHARANKLRNHNAKILLLENLDEQLSTVLSPTIPDISEKLLIVGKANKSEKLFDYKQIMDVKMENRIRDIYHLDFVYYYSTKSDWNKKKYN